MSDERRGYRRQLLTLIEQHVLAPLMPDRPGGGQVDLLNVGGNG